MVGDHEVAKRDDHIVDPLALKRALLACLPPSNLIFESTRAACGKVVPPRSNSLREEPPFMLTKATNIHGVPLKSFGQKNSPYGGTEVPDYSNAATQHRNSGPAPPFVCIDVTGVLSPQGVTDDSNLNHQAHAQMQVAGNNDGPPPIGININDPADGSAIDNYLRKMANLLFGMGFGTLTMSVATALYKAPRGVVFERYKPAYYGTLAVISVCGMAEVAVAFCVSRCRRFVRVVLCASVAPFATVVALGGFSVVMKG